MTPSTLKLKLGGNRVTLDLGGIQDGTHPVSFEAPAGELALGDEGERLLRDFALEGSLIRAGGHIEICGSLTGLLETVCDRCLARFAREIRSQLNMRVLCGEVGGEGDAGEDEGVDRLPPGSTQLDLTGHLREAALLEIPIKNLCREECRGLCPRCGVNRNAEDCDCDPPAGDSRWDALRGLGSSPAVTKKEE